jgi:DNA-binding NarL/FixJ family response regulator
MLVAKDNMPPVKRERSLKEGRTALPIRIFVAESHAVVRIGIANLLQDEGGIEITGESGTGEDALTRTLSLRPDILLLDGRLPNLPGREDARTKLKRLPSLRILLLTEAITQREIFEALELGAHGIVLKGTLTEYLVPAIRALSAGHSWVGQGVVQNLLDALQETTPAPAESVGKLHGLTPRELEVIGCVVQGRSNRDIAQQFHLSEETVKRHLSNIFEKTDVSTRLELALYAIKHQLVALNS